VWISMPLTTLFLPNLMGQQLLDFSSVINENTHQFIDLDIEVGYDSDGINSGLAKAFLEGGFIDREIRESSVPKNDNSILRFGSFASSKLNLSFNDNKLFKSDSLNLFISIFQESAYVFDLNQDSYNLFFFGNEMFRGEKVELDKLRFNSWSLQSIGFGMLNIHNQSQITFNVYRGTSHRNFSINNSSLFTENDGTAINADINASLFDNKYGLADRAKTSGLGVGFNGKINLLPKNIMDNLFLNFSNIGLMFWPDGGEKIIADSLYNFEGVLFNEFFDPSSESDTVPILNSYFTTERENGENVSVLPVRIGLNYLKTLSEKTTINIGFESQHINLWRPEFSLAGLKGMSPKLFLGAGVKYGGYGKANFNLLTYYSPTDNWMINTNISYLSGWISSNGYGMAASLGVTHFLNSRN
jgi:hypothetical protein